jgi:aminopeptidase N
MESDAPATLYLKDYTPPPFLIQQVELDIDFVAEDDARVTAQLTLRRNPAAACSP